MSSPLAFLGDYQPTLNHFFFNIDLFEKFDSAVTSLTNGKFVPSKFDFVQNQTPLADNKSVISAITLYYVIIFGGRYVLSNTEPLKLKKISQIHNLILTSLSLLLLVLFIEQLLPLIYNYGLYYSICNIGAWTQPLVCLYYLNYLTKFFEFTDTLLLVLKHKKLTFLHTYHHGATALLCYTQLCGETSISWVPITLNLGVHCVMYWYYFLASTGIRVWWKEWVTRFQIVQFILDIGFIYFASYQKLVHTFIPSLPHCGDCVGSTLATINGCIIISSYLFLFIAFYIEVYRKNTKKSKLVKRAAGGVANKVNEYVQVDVSNAPTPSPSPAPTKRKSRKN